MICKKCGTENDDNSTICTKCGLDFTKTYIPEEYLIEMHGNKNKNSASTVLLSIYIYGHTIYLMILGHLYVLYLFAFTLTMSAERDFILSNMGFVLVTAYIVSYLVAIIKCFINQLKGKSIIKISIFVLILDILTGIYIYFMRGGK